MAYPYQHRKSRIKTGTTFPPNVAVGKKEYGKLVIFPVWSQCSEVSFTAVTISVG